MINNTLFTGNKAEFGDIGGGALLNINKTVIKSCVFKENQAKTAGGAIRDSDSGSCDIQNSKFDENYAYKEGTGGAICHKCNGTLTVHNSDFNLNSGDSVGGAIFHQGSELIDIKSNIFKGNHANSGGALFIDGPATLENNNVINNNAKEGGAVSNTFIGTYSYPNINLYNNNFSKNKATECGGGLLNNGNAKLTYNNFTMNTVMHEETADDAGIHRAGAIFNVNGTLLINRGNEFFHNIINNNIDETGGGLSNYFEGNIIIQGHGNKFTDTNIYNGGYLRMDEVIIEYSKYFGQYLNTTDSKTFTLKSCSTIPSNHQCGEYPYSKHNGTETFLDDIPYVSKIFDMLLNTKRTYLNDVKPVSVHRGENVRFNFQLWEDSNMLPYDTRLYNENIYVRIYNKTDLVYYGKTTTNWWGCGNVHFKSSDIPVGDYCVLISYSGDLNDRGPCSKVSYLTVM